MANFGGKNREAKLRLKHGELVTGTLTCTEDRRRTMITVTTSLADDLEKVRIDVSDFVAELKKGIECRTYEDEKIELMRSTFVDFDESSLVELLKIATTSGRNYGSFDILKK